MDFDVTDLMEQTVEAEMTTQLPAIPKGDRQLIIKSLRILPPTADRKPMLFVENIIDDAEVKELTGQAEPVATLMMFLDVDDRGMLLAQEPYNMDLGKLRRAVGQNTSEDWKISYLQGQVYSGMVSTRVNKNTGDNQYSVNNPRPID
jgi:hypothetical protein